MLLTDQPVVELRQYVLKPGATDALVEVFETHFVDSQEELGMAIGGLFRDRDDVLLLRPTEPPHPPSRPRPRAPVGSVATGGEWVVVTAWLHEPGHGTCDWLAESVQPLVAEALGTCVATWRTEPAENTFPALPVRPDHAFVWTATFADHPAYAAALASLDRHPRWPATLSELDRRKVRAETLRLLPTARSAHPPAG